MTHSFGLGTIERMTALILVLALVAMNGVVVALQIWAKRRRERGDEGETPYAAQNAGWGHRT